MRDGVPLPGSTPSALASLLAHRVFGPLRLDRVRAVLDYHGMAGYPADHRSVEHVGIRGRPTSSVVKPVELDMRNAQIGSEPRRERCLARTRVTGDQ